ncbi:MAG: ABC-type polysaccharide/polyol phosphate transport system ATPase subunit [Planctomycetota bacterium]|jgi:ABC-type polysaccharide/polyol phosphate transport system ATPase subunit
MYKQPKKTPKSKSETGLPPTVIRAEGLSKVYEMYKKPIHRLWDFMLPGKSRATEFWALQDITLDLPAQSTIGIIGENGAGKSTLLKLLSGIAAPTTGTVEIHGRVTSLIELGAGFHPEFTGRENIGLACAILGLSDEETVTRIPEIIEFSELGDFIDRPVKTYSSGMHVRLGFAVATCVEPDVMLVDEALSVGDEYFKGKCMNRLNLLRENGGTVVFVSHDMSAVKTLCQHVIYLDGGRIVEQGTPEKVADEYLRRAQVRGKAMIDSAEHGASAYPRWGSQEILVDKVELLGDGREATTVFRTGEQFVARMKWKAYADCTQPTFGLGLYRADGTYVNGSNHLWNDDPIEINDVKKGETGSVEMDLGALPLLQGRYYVTVFVYDHSKPSPTPVDHREHALSFQVMDTKSHQHGMIRVPTTWRVTRNDVNEE